MKKILFGISAIVLLLVAACNNNDKSSQENDMSKMNNDTTQVDGVLTTITPAFADLNEKLSTDIKIIVDHYLHIKNALVNNSGSEAADGGKAMADAISKVDKSLFTADQKKVYDSIEDDLKENAKHIGASGSSIEHQREHFSTMSEEVYNLVKSFGGGQTLYRDDCSMANDNEGATWLSEMKEVKNPYFGGKMNSCVKVREVIK